MSQVLTEVIAIGDELTSGVRLDTNSQWLSLQLQELGLHVGYHSTVGDDRSHMIEVFSHAARRAEVVVCTGGLGPTADDMTRHVWAEIGDVPLELHAGVMQHIETMFRSRKRAMPANNRVQAMFPVGSRVIPNPEGSAPGIEWHLKLPAGGSCLLIALPGVPVEMKQMWHQDVMPRLRDRFDLNLTTHHHTLRCFGTGESALEEMLPDLIRRGRDPLVGITASAATISLRVTTKASSVEACMEKMQPTIALIRDSLGDLIFGENGDRLEDAVVRQFLSHRRRVRVIDAGLHGEVARRIAIADPERNVLVGGEVVHASPQIDADGPVVAAQLRQMQPDERDVLVGIGPLNRDESQVASGDSRFHVTIKTAKGVIDQAFRFSGHSAWRETRAVKDVLNLLRLLHARVPELV